MADNFNRVQNVVNMRIADPKIREIIGKCDSLLDHLKESSTFKNNAQICREFGSKLKEMKLSIESIVNNQLSNNKKFNV